MGNGRRNGSLLNFQITAKYSMSDNDILRWKRAFFKASEIFHNATNGQLRFGNIYVSNNNQGVNNAEYVLDPNVSGRATATLGDFGVTGRSINLPAYAQTEVLSILHELGHHLWSLHEEYARSISHRINREADLPANHNNRIIPLQTSTSTIPDADYVGADAILSFNGVLETRQISSKSGNRINVSGGFSGNPQDNEMDSVLVQFAAECTGDRTTGACIMEFSRGAAGTLDNSGNWTPATNPVTEFCTDHNHDPDENTAQHDLHGKSCWDTIILQDDFTDFTAPASGTASNKTAPSGYTEPVWIELKDQPRLALVLDRSGSMNENGGSRLAGVKTGAAYWLENAAVEDDLMTVIWYNSGHQVALNLVDFGNLSEGQVTDLINQINGQSASGATNIRDALFKSLAELGLPGFSSALQAALLLTDGAHNTPLYTSMEEVIPAFQTANTNIYTLGVGTGVEMDLEGLNTLSSETGGASFASGDGGDPFDIQNNMMEINNLIRGGIVDSTDDTMPDTKESALDKLRLDVRMDYRKRPSLAKIQKLLSVKGLDELVSQQNKTGGHTRVFNLQIEEKATSATFNLSHRQNTKLWMYLLDPDGIEVDPTYSGFDSQVSPITRPYEFIKVNHPKAGIWKVVALNPRRGAGSPLRVFAGVQHRELSVFGKAEVIKQKCGLVKFIAGAKYNYPLSELTVEVKIKSSIGAVFSAQLHDDHDDGAYKTLMHLAPGFYTGKIEIFCKKNVLMASAGHAIVKAEKLSELGDLRAGNPSFVRSIPVSFYIKPDGAIKTSRWEYDTKGGR